MVRKKQIFPSEGNKAKDQQIDADSIELGSQLPLKSGLKGSKLPDKSGENDNWVQSSQKKRIEQYKQFNDMIDKPSTSQQCKMKEIDRNVNCLETNRFENRKRKSDTFINLDEIDLDESSKISICDRSQGSNSTEKRLCKKNTQMNLKDLVKQKPILEGENKTKDLFKRKMVGFLFKKAEEQNNISKFSLQDFNIECLFCKALHFPEEKPINAKGRFNEFYLCCNYGKFERLIGFFDTYPEDLKTLFSEENNLHRHFIENIRKYNNSFACASLACNRFSFSTPGPSCYKISGQVYHKFNSTAQPIDQSSLPTNGQLYFLDSSEAQNVRLNSFELNEQLIGKIEKLLRKNYPFAKAYEMMKNVINEQKTFSDTSILNETQEVKMFLSFKSGFDPNRYNIQQSNEVAAIMVCNANDEVPPANLVVVEKGSKELKNIFPLDPIVEPLTYPLLYPLGTKGWNMNIKDKTGKRISFCDFTKFKLFFRENVFLPHHYSAKLFQQWCVDQAARVEWNRLNFIRTHQKELKACNYKGLADYLINKAEQSEVNIGRQVILPSSFVGGARNKDQNFIDSMAIVGENGKPDLFITYTINPEDFDIKKCLLKGQKTEDRPDIVARVFKLKADKLIEEVVNGEIFGTVIAYCWVVEFQKRGLPHLHFLVTLHPKDKLKNINDIDKLIRAELPDSEKEPILRSAVKKFMMHGPCSDLNKNAPCMRNGKCRFKYPKKFREETQLGEDGYALYKRPNNGDFEYVKGIKLTNQNIAPYNPYLLLRFQSHINVEVCSEINAVKYIYKYIYKGYDAAIVQCVKEGPNGEQILLKYDEVGQYLEARYLSPVEACYRLFKYELQGKSHKIERLDVHLENEQVIYFDENANDVNLEEALQKRSKLIAYFDFFNDCPNAPKFKYVEMPTYCTFDNKNRKWKWPRKGTHKVIGRIYTVNPKNKELYYLRYLLLHKHATSFEDLKTVNGVKFKTYAEACLAMGLTRDDMEWDKCLNEASQFKFPKGLRALFANILINCEPKYPSLLWEKYKDALSNDLKKLYPENIAYQIALSLLNQNLLKQERSLESFSDMPKINENYKNFSEDHIINPKEELNLALNKYSIMNEEQKNIFDYIKDTIEHPGENKKNCFYIDGPGGTGKSFLQSALFHLARGFGKRVTNMAFSGIAATLLKNGRTVHNRFKLPLDLNSNSSSSIENSSKEGIEIRDTDIFIFDEAPMAPKYAVEIIDRKLREIHKNNITFGGKILILSGDFRQCLPIKNKATKEEIIDLTLQKSELWSNFKIFHLTQNMRSDPEAKIFSQQLLEIGNGDKMYITLPKICDIQENNLVDEIFGEIISKKEFSKLCNHCILAPYNREIDLYNEQILSKFPGSYYTFNSIDEAESKGAPILPELLNKLETPSLPNHELKLKINCITKLIRNINVSLGLCNGTRLQILDIGKNVLRVMILTGDRKGEIDFIPRITLIEEKKFPYVLKRHQFPLKLAFCMTINGAQGQTFEKIGIDLTREVFSHGQLYVALSRTRNWERIKIKFAKENIEKRIKNIVWVEAL